MSSDASSLEKSLVDAAGGQSAFREFLPSPAQLDLLAGEDGKLPPGALRDIRQKRGPGRPEGARNKRNEKIAKWFIEKFGDPLTALGEIMTTPPDQIYQMMIAAQGGEAKNKRVTGRDAMEFWRSAVLDVLPYVHGKQPIAVDVTGRADAVLIIPGLNAPEGFTSDQLGKAADALGVEAIEKAGIRLQDGRLLTAGDDDEQDDNEQDDGRDEGSGDGDSGA